MENFIFCTVLLSKMFSFEYFGTGLPHPESTVLETFFKNDLYLSNMETFYPLTSVNEVQLT